MARKITGGLAGSSTFIGTIQISANAELATADDQNITISPGAGGILISTTAFELSTQSELRFSDADSSNWVGFKPPATIVSDVIWTLPATDGSSDQVLTTNAAGTLSWSSKSVIIGDENTTATFQYPLFTTATSGAATSVSVSSSKLTYQPSTGTVSSSELRASASTGSSSKTTGALVVTGGAGIGGSLYVGGDIVAFAASDIRLKENITKIDNSLEKLLKISGYEYYWNSIAQELHPERTTLDVGVIAQEVKEVLPSAVVQRDDGYLAVNYNKIIPLLIESIKTLKEEIDNIKREI